MLGRALRVVVDGQHSAGTYTVNFDARDLPGGLYVYRLDTPDGSTSRIMSLMK